jgi:hypothetical protein
VTNCFRLAAAAPVLAVGLWLAMAPAPAAAPPALPKDSFQKAIKAEVAFLQDKTDALATDFTKNRGAVRTVKASALNLSVYAEAVKDDAIRSQAIKVYEAMDKKDFKAAVEAAKGLSSPKADPAVKPIKATNLEDIMSPFRVAKAGGQNIEADIKGAMKEGKIDPAAAELIGVRSSVIAAFTLDLPTDKAVTNNAQKMKWARWTADMANASKELTEEGAKGKSADDKKLIAAIKKLDASCVNCHNDFRNEP